MATLVDRTTQVQSLVRTLRSRGFTPMQIARKADVSLRTVYRWQKGETGLRGEAVVNRLERLVEGSA